MGVKEKIGRSGEIRSVNFLDKTITLSLSCISIEDLSLTFRKREIVRLWPDDPGLNCRSWILDKNKQPILDKIKHPAANPVSSIQHHFERLKPSHILGGSGLRPNFKYLWLAFLRHPVNHGINVHAGSNGSKNSQISRMENMVVQLPPL